MNPADILASEKTTDLVWIGGKPYPIKSQAMVESTYTDRNGKTQPLCYNAITIDMPEPATRKPDATATRKGDFYAQHRASGAMTEQQQRIVTWLSRNPHRAFTRQELAERLGMGINVVCARVHELIRAERAVESCTQRCTVTGNNVRGVTLA